jgi:hypothetical protein
MTMAQTYAPRTGSFDAPLTPAQRPQTAPHLSVVAVSRNDDHGGDLRGRMQHFVDGFIAQCRKHGLNAELILVEWNPPPERPPLEDALNWPAEFGPASVRIVTVPPSLHAALPHSAALPLFQMIGKNVGIRRARGRFVLATNIDILFDDATVRYLRDRLRPGTMLRADRYDVPGDLAKNGPFDRALAECRGRWFQVNTRLGTLDADRRRLVGRDDGSLTSRLLALYCEAQVFGWSEPIGRAGERFAHRIQDGCDAFAAWRSLLTRDMIARGTDVALRTARRIPARLWRELTKLQPLATLSDRSYWRIRRALQRIPTDRVRRKMRRIPQKAASFLRRVPRIWELILPLVQMTPQSPVKRRLTRMRRLHTNGCGDFTLLSRDDWFRLRGYPEWPIFSWHIDSVLMFAASANDIPQVALDAEHRIYHIHHSTGSGWSHEGAAQLFARLDRNGVPYIGKDFVLAKQLQFAENPGSAIVNREDWGFDAYALAEREIVPAGSHAAGQTRGGNAFAQPLPAMSLQARR